MEEIELSERGQHALKPRRNKERGTRRLRCVKPSAPNPSLDRTTRILHQMKSKTDDVNGPPGFPSDPDEAFTFLSRWRCVYPHLIAMAPSIERGRVRMA
jgi:hypothetical protein